MFKKLVLCSSLIFGSSVTLAEDGGGLFVEPAVTYETSKFDVNYPGTSSDGKTNGFGLGARLGFHVSEVFFAGLDGRYSMLKIEDNNSVFNYDSDGAAYNWGPVVGIQMPDIGLRVWASYIVDARYNPDADGNLDFQFSKGKGYRVGAGFHLSSVSLNLEYQDVNYDRTDAQQLGPFTGSFDDVELKNKTWIVSVSFPIEI